MSENSTLPVDQSSNPEEIVMQDNSLETSHDSNESSDMTELNATSDAISDSGESNLDSTSQESIVENIVEEEPIAEITIEQVVDSETETESSEVLPVLDEIIEVISEPESNTYEETSAGSSFETKEVNPEITPEPTISETKSATIEPVVSEEIASENVLISVNESELEELEKAEAEAQSEDYTGLDQEQMVKLAEQLNRDNDPVTALRVIQKLRPLFDNMYQNDKNEAFEKFVAEGNEKESFEYKHSGLELRFNQASKGIYEKRKINHEFQQKEKVKNLEQKLTLLEQLRKLVDDHEHTPGYDKFKVIREEWKKIGPVGPEHAQNLNASFYSLIERFYSLSEIYHNLRDFDRKKNLDLKLELIAKIEKLANEPLISKAMKDLMNYQDDYRSLGPIPKEKLEEVKERLKKAVDVLYDRRRVFNEERKQQIAEEVTLKEAIIVKLPDFESFTSQSSKDWQVKTQELLALQEEWKAIPGRFREKTQDLNKQFWTVYKQFMNSKNDFYKQLDKGKKDVLAQKQALADEAHSLKEGEDWDGIANRMKQLQVEWKNVAPVYGKEGQKVYEEFKAGIDHFFGRLRDQRSGEDKVQTENLKEKEAICTEIEALATSGTGTRDLLESLKEKFRNVGFVPMKSIQKINARFSKGLIDLIENSKEIAGSEKERLKINLLSNRSTYSSEGVKTLKNQEGYIQKRLQQLRKDVGNLEDNVSMFKMSKNAMAMIEDVQKRINLSKLEIKELESQLKEIRAGEKA
jgi:hypothetical protein